MRHRAASPDITATDRLHEGRSMDTHDDGVDLSMVMVGDLLMHERVQRSGLLRDGSYNYDYLFAHVKDDIQRADCAVVNNEVIYGGNELGIQGYPSFSARTEVADAVAKAGFDVVLHASNHALDWGVPAVEHCLGYWEAAHPEVTVLGIHASPEDAAQIALFEKDGFRLALLNYTYGLNGLVVPEGYDYLIDLMDDAHRDKVVADIRRARRLADAVVVFPHWGTEYDTGVDGFQRRWAQLFADEGVTLALGDHTHVVGPVEWVEGAGGNRMLCYYSVANFVSTQEIAETMLGLMAKVTLHKDARGDVSVSEYGVEPLVTHRVIAERGVTTYRLSDYTPELAAENSIVECDGRWSIEFMEGICRDVFGVLYATGAARGKAGRARHG